MPYFMTINTIYHFIKPFLDNICLCRLFMSSAEYTCRLFKPIFAYRQTVWTLIRLQMTKQTTIVVTGALRVKCNLHYKGSTLDTRCTQVETASHVLFCMYSGHSDYLCLQINCCFGIEIILLSRYFTKI